MRPLALLLSLLALLALGGRSAAAAPVARFAGPAAPAGEVAPGAVVVTPVPELPAGAEEFELFLLPESGPPVRLSAELPAGVTEVRWRMPAVAARRARLVVHVGNERAEWESAPSEPFALAPLPASELERMLGGRSEAGFPLQSSAGAAGTGLSAAPVTPALAPGGPLSHALSPASPQSLARPAECTRAGRTGTYGAGLRPARPPVRSTAPAFTPLRN